MNSPSSETKAELLRLSRWAVEHLGIDSTMPMRIVGDKVLLYPDLRIYRDESFRIFLDGEEWVCVYEDDETGEQALDYSNEELEANYTEALKRLRRNTVLDELARVR